PIQATPHVAVNDLSEAACPPLSKETTAPDLQTGFIETINASIAEITKDAPLPDAKQADVSKTESRIAHVTAFLETETEQPTEIIRPEETRPKKPKPFMLRPEMSADCKQIKIEPPLHTDESPATPAPETDLNAAFQETPDKEAEEISLPETEDDDEAALHNGSDAGAPESAVKKFVDEDILREIVCEMVRAELQGDLGGRITRNVRKLVRREIHYALAARDFK
ncbi:MAG: hypothetical protein QM492_02585, partial [Rhodobacterales bacterium]